MNVQLPSSSLTRLNTTSGSILHKIFDLIRHSALGRAFPLSMIYIASSAVTFLPLLFAALSGPLSLTEAAPTHPLPFLYDWNVLFMFLVSFPSLVVCIANDQTVLAGSLNSAENDGTLTISIGDSKRLRIFWQKRFRKINYASQAIGVIVGAAVAFFNYVAYTPASVGYWIADNNRLLPVGYVLLLGVFLFYCIIPVLILRMIGVAFLLRDLIACSRLRILPLHPDKAGGLRSVGRLGLRYQYLLSIFALNIVLMMSVPFYYIQAPTTLYNLTVAAVIAYLVLGPVIFMAPMVPFHNCMVSNRNELMMAVSRRWSAELERLRGQEKSEALAKEEADLIPRLQLVTSAIEQLPVWPFDASTLRKFFAAYIMPVLSSPIAKAAFGFVKGQFFP